MTRSGLASGLSILLMATMMDTSAALAWLMASIGLRHDAVVGRHHQHGHVGDLSAARTHGGKGRVAGGVEEGDIPVVDLHPVGADVLGDAARLGRR